MILPRQASPPICTPKAGAALPGRSCKDLPWQRPAYPSLPCLFCLGRSCKALPNRDLPCPSRSLSGQALLYLPALPARARHVKSPRQVPLFPKPKPNLVQVQNLHPVGGNMSLMNYHHLMNLSKMTAHQFRLKSRQLWVGEAGRFIRTRTCIRLAPASPTPSCGPILS